MYYFKAAQCVQCMVASIMSRVCDVCIYRCPSSILAISWINAAANQQPQQPVTSDKDYHY